MFSRVLSDEQIERIHRASLSILERIGVVVPHEPMLDELEEAGIVGPGEPGKPRTVLRND